MNSASEHLADGARKLCPDGVLELEGQLEMERLEAGAGIEQPLPGEDTRDAELAPSEAQPRSTGV